ncbi:MAG: nicotinate (nicotinamide) nucleotide adenylyltransferase [Verrucomicrobiota bacterium]
MKRIGLYGGSFDPVHLGHLLVAQAALEEAQLDRIFFIPNAQSPFKPGVQMSADAQRLQMLRLALAGNCRAEVDDQETRRGGTSYSIDTVRDYILRFPEAEIFYLIGADNVELLPKWQESGELARLAKFLVVPRPGTNPAEFPPPFGGDHLRGFPLDVSASQIRERVKKGLTIEHLVPDSVAEAIRNNRLYL